MKGPVEQWEPAADERRPDWIVEQRSHRLVRPFSLEEEDDLSLGQEDDVSVEGFLEIRSAQSRMFGEKGLRSLMTVGFQTSSKDEAIHGRQAYSLGLGQRGRGLTWAETYAALRRLLGRRPSWLREVTSSFRKTLRRWY